jgi:hypothetical protein
MPFSAEEVVAQLTGCETWIDAKIMVHEILASQREMEIDPHAHTEFVEQIRAALQAFWTTCKNLASQRRASWSLEILDDLQPVR